MTWAKVDDRFNDDPRMLALSRGVRLLYVEGLVWSCRHATDGRLPRYVLGKVTDEPDAIDAAKQLVDAGIWEDTEDGWEIVGFLDELDQTPAAEIAKNKEFNRGRQSRRRRHLAGDHSGCNPKFCDVVRAEHKAGDHHQCQVEFCDVTRDVTRDTTRDQRLPNRPHPTRREDGGRNGGTRAPKGSRGAPPEKWWLGDCPHGDPFGAANCKTCASEHDWWDGVECTHGEPDGPRECVGCRVVHDPYFEASDNGKCPVHLGWIGNCPGCAADRKAATT